MKIFAGGSKSIKDIVALPNRRVLDEAIYNEAEILVGDCPGADAAIQKYLAGCEYDNVTVYASGHKVRNNIGGWKVRFVEYDPSLVRYDFYRQKDIQMELDCDCAVMAWDGKSKGTRQNIIDLMSLGKHIYNMLWQRKTDEWYKLNGGIDAEFLLGKNCFDRKVKLWLDDVQPAPHEYVRCRSVAEAKLYIQTAEQNGMDIEIIDCDDELGLYSRLGGDGINLLDWLAERGTFYPLSLHTVNPFVYRDMQKMIERYWK